MLRAVLALSLVACGPSSGDVKRTEDDATFHYDLAYGHYMDPVKANAEAALQEVLRALELNWKYPQAHVLAGLVFMGRERYLDAEKHFKAAIEQKADYYDAQNNLGTVYLATERWDDAIALFEKLSGNLRYKNPGNAQNNLGWALYQKGEKKRAQSHFHTAIKLAPKLCPPYNNLAMVFIDMGRHDRAKKWLTRVARRCPAYAEPHYHMGRILSNDGDLGGARTHFERCVKFAGESALADLCEQRLKGLPPIARKR